MENGLYNIYIGNSMLKLLIVLVGVFLVFSCKSEHSKGQKNTGVIESYKPKDTMTFPHSVHADNNIDCKYCHNPKSQNDNQELHTNVCMNCHKDVSEGNSNNQ